MNRTIAIASVMLLSSTVVSAQQLNTSSLTRTPQECTYERCALRLEGGDIFAGSESREVAALRPFRRPHLGRLPLVSDSARVYFEQVDRNYLPSQIYPLISGALVGLGYRFALHDDPSFDRVLIGLGLSGAGLGAALLGAAKQKQVDRGLSRGIWWYNQQFLTR